MSVQILGVISSKIYLSYELLMVMVFVKNVQMFIALCHNNT